MATGTTHGSVLLIGASRGLGLAIAAEYVARGARVVAIVRGAGRTALHEFREQSGGLLEIQEGVDVTVPGQVRALRRRLEGRSFELLLVNAGIATDSDPADITSEEFNRVMTTNAPGRGDHPAPGHHGRQPARPRRPAVPRPLRGRGPLVRPDAP